MSETRTDKQALAELLFDDDLAAFVTEQLAGKVPWRDVADRVNNRMPAGFMVSREALRRWYATERAA